MTPKNFQSYRILFYRMSCPHCKKYLEFIQRINLKLPVNKRIMLIDCELMRYGMVVTPLINLFDKHISGYPTLFIDGIKKGGINSVIESRAWLESYLNNEFIIPEDNDYMFNKNCQIKKTFFGERIRCQ